MAENGSGADQDVDYNYTDEGDNLEALTEVADSDAAALLDEPETTGEEETEAPATTEEQPDGDTAEGVEDPVSVRLQSDQIKCISHVFNMYQSYGMIGLAGGKPQPAQGLGRLVVISIDEVLI